MNRDQANAFRPGSPRPEGLHTTKDFSPYPELEIYLERSLWNEGKSVLLIGPPQCGKTSLGLSILKAALQIEEHQARYWTEREFLADLRMYWRFEEMTTKLPKDDSLWMEYLEWERLFWDYKECFHLFVDDMCQGYTPMQWYEIEGLLRGRDVRNLPTMLAVEKSQWEPAPSTLKGKMRRTNIIIEMGAWDG